MWETTIAGLHASSAEGAIAWTASPAEGASARMANA
ncbi:hypothetical protein HNQ77_000055 [Silvibacterium bohemicum]|uniref:Uncharacterized protein n=1 Tax=Silvibacterium bohemicum TaxID=1577686 RepID=A0A841JNF4_9BACT|nr:hypothetical protein [Silvibacterium bohemicum]